MGVSLKQARRSLGYELKELTLKHAGVEETPDSGTFTGVASGSLATRRIVSAELASLGLSGQDYRRDFYDDQWVLVCTTPPAQRMVSNQSYVGNSTVTDDLTSTAATGATPVGRVTLDRDLAAVAPAGTEVEFHSLFPPIKPDARMPSMTQVLNKAAAIISTVRTIVLTGNGAYKYDLSSYGLTRQTQLKETLDEEETPGREAMPMNGGGQLDWDGNVPYLRLRKMVPTTGTFAIKVEVPATRWVKTGSVWAASTAGYVNETDELDVDPDILNLVAYCKAAEALSRPGMDGVNASWLAEFQRSSDLAYPFVRWGQRTATLTPAPPSAIVRRQRGRGQRRWTA